MSDQDLRWLERAAALGDAEAAKELRARRARTQPKAKAGTVTGKTLKYDWETPEHLLEPPRRYWGGAIPFDAATRRGNPTQALAYAAPERAESPSPPTLFKEDFPGELVSSDGLTCPWPERVWLNPPYGKQLRAWLERVRREAARGCEILTLLTAARFEVAWFARVLRASNVVCWIRGRVAFINPATGDAVKGNGYANAFWGFNADPERFAACFSEVGSCYRWEAL